MGISQCKCAKYRELDLQVCHLSQKKKKDSCGKQASFDGLVASAETHDLCT